MRVTFTKAASRQYTISIDRERGPRLLPRAAPGFDENMPHDLAHYLVEDFFGIELGVFGQIAAGASGIFFPAAADDSLRLRRTSARIGAVGRADMQRSEELVRVCMSEWQRGRAIDTPPIAETGVRVDPDRLSQAVAQIDAVANRWQRLPVGGSLRFTWGVRTFDPATSRAGRRPGRERDARRTRAHGRH